jgi:hypothetical protein
MGNKQLIFLMAAWVLLASACVYTESGIYEVDPVPGEPPVISVTTNLDTLMDPVVTDTLEIAYEVLIENGEFYLAEAYIVNQQVYYADTTKGSFLLYRNMVYEPTTDTLYFNFYYSTNSNSLADIFNLEAHVIKLKYPITFQEGGVP